MFLIESNSLFKFNHHPSATPKMDDLLFIYEEDKIVFISSNTSSITLPVIDNIINNHLNKLEINNLYCFGHIYSQQCLLLDINIMNNINIIHYQLRETRFSHQLLKKEHYAAAAIGNHVHHFRDSNCFCGKCGNSMIDKKEEQARQCLHCTRIAYPKISPCAIVLITRGNKILLARSPHFKPNVMSVLAGFVAIGESVEQTVLREVKEEVGIEVGNIQYVCSQPWPFPNSLMLGYTAEWVSGEIAIDHHEIEQADWFHHDHLPLLPNEMSIARYLIDRYLNANLS